LEVNSRNRKRGEEGRKSPALGGRARTCNATGERRVVILFPGKWAPLNRIAEELMLMGE
jgi:hypothetical protein